MVKSYLDLPNLHPGLVDVLQGTSDLTHATQVLEEGRLAVVTSGPPPPNPGELVGSALMLSVLQRLEREYEMVIVDTPPILPVADGLLVAVHVDGVIVVTRLRETTRDRLRRTKEALDNVHARVIGVVPNAAVQREDSAYDYAYSYRDRSRSRRQKTVRRADAEQPVEAALTPAVPGPWRPPTPEDQVGQVPVLDHTIDADGPPPGVTGPQRAPATPSGDGPEGGAETWTASSPRHAPDEPPTGDGPGRNRDGPSTGEGSEVGEGSRLSGPSSSY